MVLQMDLKLLFQEAKKEFKVRLTIVPLAPLSMVSDIPGTYYKTLEVPDKFKLCGLFENILGWHFSKNDREEISKKIKEFNTKKLKNNSYQLNKSNSGFQPLLFDFFDIGLTFKQPSINYNDLWKRAFSRMDADVHPKGTPNLDYETLRRKKWITEKEKEQAQIKEELKELDKDSEKDQIDGLKSKLLPSSTSPLLLFFQENKKAYPLYYTSPTLREYIDHSGPIQIGFDMDKNLFDLLMESLIENSTAYLGNSEGWVEVILEKI